jgi:hypothetical protein
MTTYLALVTDLVNNILDAATGTGAGLAYSNAESPTRGVYSDFGWQTVVAGTFSGISVTLEASLDGTNWEVLDTTTDTAGEYRAVSGKPVQFLRANVGTFTGGTSVTVLLVIGR